MSSNDTNTVNHGEQDDLPPLIAADNQLQSTANQSNNNVINQNEEFVTDVKKGYELLYEAMMTYKGFHPVQFYADRK